MSWNRERMVDLVLRAGELALRRKRNLRREFKEDRSLVTQADREVEALLAGELESPGEGVHVIGEETVGEKGEEYIRRALGAETYVIDPIDGTSPYAHGMPNWGVSVGRMEDGELRDGAVYLPEFRELVINDGERLLEGVLEGGRWRWRDLPPPRREPGHARLVGITQRVAKRGQARVRNPVQALGAAVVPLLGLLQGRFSAYLGSVKLWDVAGALPHIIRAGFAASVIEGGEVRRVGREVNERLYHLEPESRRRWYFRSDLLICYPEDEESLRAAFRDG